MEGWRDTVAAAEGGFTQKAAAGSQSSTGVRQKDTEEGQKSFGHVKAPP